MTENEIALTIIVGLLILFNCFLYWVLDNLSNAVKEILKHLNSKNKQS